MRHGTTTLFAALSTLDGKVIGTCMKRHRHQEWIKFLKLIDVTCSPFPDPAVMRVFEPEMGKEILDEFSSQEAAFARADHRASA